MSELFASLFSMLFGLGWVYLDHSTWMVRAQQYQLPLVDAYSIGNPIHGWLFTAINIFARIYHGKI